MTAQGERCAYVYPRTKHACDCTKDDLIHGPDSAHFVELDARRRDLLYNEIGGVHPFTPFAAAPAPQPIPQADWDRAMKSGELSARNLEAERIADSAEPIDAPTPSLANVLTMEPVAQLGEMTDTGRLQPSWPIDAPATTQQERCGECHACKCGATIDGLNYCLANERAARKMAEESYAKALAELREIAEELMRLKTQRDKELARGRTDAEALLWSLESEAAWQRLAEYLRGTR